MAFKAAFYRGTQAGVAGFYNRVVRWWTRSPYSHVELVFAGGLAASSSAPDGGVRFKRIDFDPDKWDFVDLPGHLAPAALDWFDAHAGAPYDWLGIVHFAMPPVADDKQRWFCSEAAAAALGMPDPARFDPGALHAILTFFTRPANAGFFTPDTQGT